MTRKLGLVLLAAMLVPTAATRVQAQAMPTVFYACYVPLSGTVYRIRVPGLSSRCWLSSHTMFSWIDGLPGYDHGLLNGRSDDDHPQYLLVDGTRAMTGALSLGGFKITGLGAGTATGDAVRFEQAVKVADPAGGDLDGAYPNPTVDGLQGRAVSSAAPAEGHVLTYNATTTMWEPRLPSGGGGGASDHGALAGLADDDHPQYLLGNGVRASDGFAVTWAGGSSASLPSGNGVRLMWLPGKRAFRAGEVNGTEWDDANVGFHSIALGTATTASAGQSVAIGTNATASGFGSVALGQSTTASGNYATALGEGTIASGVGSTAMGRSTTASAAWSTAMGLNAIASGFASTAMGRLTTASGLQSTAMGNAASTNGHAGSFAYGDWSDPTPFSVTADNSFVVRAQHVWFGTSGDQPASAPGYLTADGIIASTLGGFRFPDGTVQTTAATGGGGVSDHGALSGLTDDDHAQYVLTDGVRTTTNGLAVVGTLNSGVIPVTGSGVRMMWYPRSAALRAGGVDGMQWDAANTGHYSTALGYNTTASSAYTTAMGGATTASGFGATALGVSTTASGDYSVALGASTTASGNAATALGSLTTASGPLSTAIGSFASTNSRTGSFVYGDAFTTMTVNAIADNSFVVRAQRVWFGTSGNQVATADRYLETSTGAYLSTGGAWVSVSDVNRKEHFRDEDGAAVLASLSRLPIRSWSYRVESPSIRHLGPTAQDFHAVFGLGQDNTTISTLDESGVALLAIQALERRTREQASEIAALRAELAALRKALGAPRKS